MSGPRLPHEYYAAQSADQRWWLLFQPKRDALRQQRALWNTLVDLKEYVMSAAENYVARLNAATDDIAGDLRTIRDQLANVQAASESEKAAAVDAALAQFEGPIARLESLGRDESNPVPEQPSEPSPVEPGPEDAA